MLSHGVSAALTGSAGFLLLSLVMVGLFIRQRSADVKPVIELNAQPYVDLEDDVNLEDDVEHGVEHGVRLTA